MQALVDSNAVQATDCWGGLFASAAQYAVDDGRMAITHIQMPAASHAYNRTMMTVTMCDIVIMSVIHSRVHAITHASH